MDSIILASSVLDIGNDILQWIQDKTSALMYLLPTSPFRKAINLIGNIPYIEYINWFIPIDEIVFITMAWGSAIALYYGYMIIFRWLKAID